MALPVSPNVIADMGNDIAHATDNVDLEENERLLGSENAAQLREIGARCARVINEAREIAMREIARRELDGEEALAFHQAAMVCVNHTMLNLLHDFNLLDQAEGHG